MTPNPNPTLDELIDDTRRRLASYATLLGVLEQVKVERSLVVVPGAAEVDPGPEPTTPKPNPGPVNADDRPPRPNTSPPCSASPMDP